MTISAAGFGRRIDWDDDKAPPGHTISFKRSVEMLNTGLFIRVLCPKWIFEWGPTKKIREARNGFAEFRVCSLRTQPPTATLRLRVYPMRIVVFGGDDQRAQVFRREGREEGPPFEFGQCERGALG